jgi:metallo-beta-lactamase family protein
MHGGSIMRHIKHNISREGAHVMIVGYQAYGMLGRKLVDNDPIVRIYGEDYQVRASIHTVGGLSAHTDIDNLLRWIGNFNSKPRVHVVHGGPESKAAFRDKLAHELGLDADIHEPCEQLEL